MLFLVPVISEAASPVTDSCVLYARQFKPDLPPMRTPDDLKPNSIPTVGSAVLMRYGKVPHIAIVTSLHEKGFYIVEANYHRGRPGVRFIKWNDRHLRGFYI